MGPLHLKIFMSGHSRAVRLPRALGFEGCTELVAILEGETLVLKRGDRWPDGFAELPAVSESFAIPSRQTAEEQEARLGRLFGEV